MHLFLLLVLLGFSTPLSAFSWAQKCLHDMTPDEKIGQLFMIAGYVDQEFGVKETTNPNIIEDTERFIREYHVGGIGLVGPSESAKQVAYVNRLQEMSKYPLLIGQDLEWGLSMRLSDGMRFPKNITLGALSENQLIYQMGREIARQAKLVGVHMNFSPDIDVNIEPENLAINVRSFGESPQNVAQKGIAMMQGLQDGGLIANAKHFPGLGDITTDPHLGLPVNLHPRKRLEEVELYPFLQIVQAGVISIQTEHVCMPALEPDPKLPASLSTHIVQGILRDKFGFHGLIVSGALRMKALTNHFSKEEIVLKAFLAGSDILLMPEDLPSAHQTLKKALVDGTITQEQIDERVLKILELKERFNLPVSRKVAIPVASELHTQEALELKQKIYSQTVKLVRDEMGLVPLQERDVAYLQLGEAPNNAFYEAIKAQLTLVPLDLDELIAKLDQYQKIVVAIFPADPRRIAQIRLQSAEKQLQELKDFRVHGLSAMTVACAKALEKLKSKLILCYFGNPFGLHFFDGFSTLIMAYEDDPEAQKTAAKIIAPISRAAPHVAYKAMSSR